jgi:hypothetical protein
MTTKLQDVEGPERDHKWEALLVADVLEEVGPLEVGLALHLP